MYAYLQSHVQDEHIAESADLPGLDHGDTPIEEHTQDRNAMWNAAQVLITRICRMLLNCFQYKQFLQC